LISKMGEEKMEEEEIGKEEIEFVEQLKII
jgi:hypothetical protein